MPPSGDAIESAGKMYPDLTQFYFNEGLEFGPQGEQPLEPTSPYQTLLRPDYPLYPEIIELNITEEEVPKEIAPDYPPDSSNEDFVSMRVAPDYSVGSTTDCTKYTTSDNMTTSRHIGPLAMKTRLTTSIALQNQRQSSKYVVANSRQTVRQNMNKLDKKILNDKTILNENVIEFFPAKLDPKDQLEFQSWMNWRTQVNRQLVAMILIKHGKRVLLRPSELERKPLPNTTIRSVIDNAYATNKNWMTGLPGKPFIMYGIPRAQLTA